MKIGNELLTGYAINELRANTDASCIVATLRLLLRITGQCKTKFGQNGVKWTCLSTSAIMLS